ncbi:hypothetical protein BY458DRAFT_448269 [Sporodiniella umbellata]|nr:hypothetical protein BY458DRAFT_448269 [Sporodiniella umbellata]
MPIENLLRKFINREKDIRTESWYLAALCSISSSNRPDDAESLYNVISEHVNQLPDKSQKEKDQILVDVLVRLREATNKSYPLLGFPKSMNIVYFLTKAVPDNIKSLIPDNPEGLDTSQLMKKIYDAKFPDSFTPHKLFNPAFMGILVNHMYGPIFSDWSVLGPKETSFVIISSTMAQNAPSQYIGHCLGAIKNGAEEHEVENIRSVVRQIMGYYNLPVPA